MPLPPELTAAECQTEVPNLQHSQCMTDVRFFDLQELECKMKLEK